MSLPYRLIPSTVYYLLLLSLIMAGCLPASRRPTAGHTDAHSIQNNEALERARSNPETDPLRRRVVDEAARWLGTPYVYGGSSVQGVDCSGFVYNVFSAINLRLPRQSSQQATIGTEVDPDHALPGDLVFFNTSGSGVSHVGIMLEPPAFIHASTSKGVVVSSLAERYYSNHVVCARRVLEK